MKRFSVTCDEVTTAKLADFLTAHLDPSLPTYAYDPNFAARIAKASDAIDSALAANPLQVGTAMVANVRLLVEPPLAVVYAVYEDDRMVILLEYRLCPSIESA